MSNTATAEAFNNELQRIYIRTGRNKEHGRILPRDFEYAIKQAIATHIIGEDRLPTYREGVVIGEQNQFSSKMADSPIYGSGYNTAKGEMRQTLHPTNDKENK